MSEYSETRNAAVNGIIARLWEFDDDAKPVRHSCCCKFSVMS